MNRTSSQDSLLEGFISELDLDSLADEAGWSPRSRKVTALGWCLSLCRACSRGVPSLRTAALFMGVVCRLTVSKQAIHKRLLLGGDKLLRNVLAAAVAAKARLPERKPLGGFARVLIQDSTVIALPKSMEAHCPGSSNQHSSTAALKIQAVYDMAGNAFLDFGLSAFTRNDQAAAMDILDVVQAGDLVLRDLGFFALASLRAIADRKAYFLSRYRSDVALVDPRSSKPIALLAALRGKDSVDMEAQLGASARLPVRLVAVKLKQEVADRRRQKAKENRDRRCRPSSEALELLGWQIMLTNCPAELLPLNLACRLYSLRWRIETIFKSWKSGLKMDAIPSRVSKQELDAFVCAGLLSATIVHAVVIPWLEQDDPTRGVSVCKLMEIVAISADLAGADPKDCENLLRNLSKHCRYEKRKRRDTLQNWDRLVSEMEHLS